MLRFYVQTCVSILFHTAAEDLSSPKACKSYGVHAHVFLPLSQEEQLLWLLVGQSAF